ncbi:MAG: hypothetical protein NUW00_01625 [Candidatus Kaiserbacteria bacterium]|nr:hypothetical protein [Candidatus Kaiserbacteria bacterium]
MNAVVIMDEEQASRIRALRIIAFGLLCFGFGYLFAQMQPEVPKSAELEMTKKLQQAKNGDYAVLKDGEVFRIGGSVMGAVIEEGRIYYNTRTSVETNHLYRPNWQMAALVVEVISPTSESYAVITQCFYKGKVVTTVGPAKWTCT